MPRRGSRAGPEIIERRYAARRFNFRSALRLGRLFVAEANWRKALEEFKLALASKASPEAHYAVGCSLLSLNRDALAARHLRKALELDDDYSEAFYVLGLIAERSGETKTAEDYFMKAGAGPNLRRAKAAKSKRLNSVSAAAAPLFRVSPANARRLITGGDRRLAEALREDALNACSASYSDSR